MGLTQIRSFLFISDVFLCLSTIIFSRNMKLPNGRFLENLDSTVSTGQLEQKMTLFAIFQDDSCGQSSWKIAKTAIFCSSRPVETVLFWSYFLRKSDIFFQKSAKNGKKFKKNILKIINITHSIYALMYVLKKKKKIE